MDVPAHARHGLIVARDLSLLGEDDRRLRREHNEGAMVRIRRGAYMPAAEWDRLDDRGHHLARARAVAAAATTEPVFSHHTAAAAHGLPLPYAFPPIVDITVEQSSGARSRGDIRRHAIGIDSREVVRVAGLLVTDVPRTVADLAITGSLQSSLPAIDYALARGIRREELFRAVETSRQNSGIGRAEAAVTLGDARSGSVGESLSRAGMIVLGFPPPTLQFPISDGDGLIGIVDFAWPSLRLVGEFDGHGKYLREELTGGRSPGEVVIAEKRREDRIRAVEWRFARWGWPEARSLAELNRVLRFAGLTPIRAAGARFGAV